MLLMIRPRISLLAAAPAVVVAVGVALALTASATTAAVTAKSAAITIRSVRAASSIESDVSFAYTCTGSPVVITHITVSVYDLTTSAMGSDSYAEPGATCDGTPHDLFVAINTSNLAESPSFRAGDQAQAGISICDGTILLASAARALTLNG
jgi:hypothetical protein